MITGESRPVSKAAGVEGDRRHDQRRRQPARAGDRHRRARPPWPGSCAWWRKRSTASRRPRCWPTRRPAGCSTSPWRVAALTAVAWTIAVGFNVEVIERVATVLVIACPHALGLAIPLVVAITTAMGAKQRHPGARPAGAGRCAPDRHGHLRQDRHADRGRVRRGGHGGDAKAGTRSERWRWRQPSKATRSTPSRAASAAARRSAAVRLPEVTDFAAIKGRACGPAGRGGSAIRWRSAPAGELAA